MWYQVEAKGTFYQIYGPITQFFVKLLLLERQWRPVKGRQRQKLQSHAPAITSNRGVGNTGTAYRHDGRDSFIKLVFSYINVHYVQKMVNKNDQSRNIIFNIFYLYLVFFPSQQLYQLTFKMFSVKLKHKRKHLRHKTKVSAVSKQFNKFQKQEQSCGNVTFIWV